MSLTQPSFTSWVAGYSSFLTYQVLNTKSGCQVLERIPKVSKNLLESPKCQKFLYFQNCVFQTPPDVGLYFEAKFHFTTKLVNQVILVAEC